MIRRATVRDFPQIIAFADMMKTQMIGTPDPRLIAADVLGALQFGHCFVAEVAGEIVGTVGYEITTPFGYSRDRALMDRWIAVRESHRGGHMAGRLILTLEKEAESFGVAFMPAVTGDQTYRETFEKRYGKPVAVLYRKVH